MSSLFVSLKRAPRVHGRKNSIPAELDVARLHSRSSTVSRRKTRPPPLQIIPELSENFLDIGVPFSSSPVTARPTQSFSSQPKLDTARITLSAYAFSIDDALLMFGDDAPHSPALSASSSTSDGASSEDVLTTPQTSDDEYRYEFALPTPRLCPQRISVRPLRIAKTRSLTCHEDEDIQNYLEQEEAVTEKQSESPIETKAATEASEQDFYTLEFGDFISLSCAVPTPTYPARRDSLTLAAEASPIVIDAPEPKLRGRSRHSKPLPLLPPATPPLSTLPQVPITVEGPTVHRKHDISSPFGCSPAVSESRPFPRVAIPVDIEGFPKDNSDIPLRGSIATEKIFDGDEDASIYSRCSVQYTAFTSFHPIPREISETPINDDVTLPRASIDSDAPRSSIDSTSSFASSTSSHSPFSCLEGAEPEYTERLRSRWSSSTLGSFTEAPRSTTLLSPLRNVLGSRARRMLLPPQRVSPQTSPEHAPSALLKNKQSSPLSTLGKHLRRQGSRSSTSSGGTSSSDRDSHDGSPSGLKRKPIPAAMFLRAT